MSSGRLSATGPWLRVTRTGCPRRGPLRRLMEEPGVPPSPSLVPPPNPGTERGRSCAGQSGLRGEKARAEGHPGVSAGPQHSASFPPPPRVNSTGLRRPTAGATALETAPAPRRRPRVPRRPRRPAPGAALPPGSQERLFPGPPGARPGKTLPWDRRRRREGQVSRARSVQAAHPPSGERADLPSGPKTPKERGAAAAPPPPGRPEPKPSGKEGRLPAARQEGALPTLRGIRAAAYLLPRQPLARSGDRGRAEVRRLSPASGGWLGHGPPPRRGSASLDWLLAPLGASPSFPPPLAAYKASRRRRPAVEKAAMGRLLAVWLVAAAAAWGSWGLLPCLALEQGPNCNATQYLEQMPSGDWCCSRCPPGQKVKTPCDGESDTVCQPCDTEHFQAGWTKEKHCTPYTYCDLNAGLRLHVPGTATRDAECRCLNGHHCSSPECQTCRPNKPCGPGEGVQKEASHLEDTICVECPEGFFSSVSSATAPCQPWSRCVDRNLVQKANGTRESDVTCDDVRATRPSTSAPPTSAPHREAGRTHLLALVLLPLGALVMMGAAFVIRHRKCKGGQKEPHDQGHLPNGRQQPAEMAFDDQLCPALPIQETLRGGQYLTPEDSKESCFAAQEQV